MSSFDTNERANVIFPWYESRINKGNGHYMVASDADLDIAVPLILAFKTPATASTYLRDFKVTAECTEPATIEILEGSTITVDTATADVDPLNQNRNSAVTSGIWSIKTVPVVNEAAQGSTITVDGTSLRSIPFGLTSVNNQIELEIPVLKADTIYAIRLTTTADNAIGKIQAEWLEYVWG